MKIVRELATNKVVYAFVDKEPHCLFGTHFKCDNIRAIDINLHTHDVVEKVTLPDNFRVGAYSYYNGSWAVINQPAVDTMLADLLAKIVQDKKDQIKDTFIADSQRPEVDTGLGFSVDGGRDNLQDFQGGLALNVLTVRASDNTFHTVTVAEMEQIITAIQANGLALYQTKWAAEQAVDDIVANDSLSINEKIASINAL